VSKKLYLASLGCTKNLVDSEVMLGKLKEHEITNSVEEADVIIVNTCGFIDSAKEESISTIFELNEARKDNSNLVVSGCLTERYKDELTIELKDEVDFFTGVSDYDKIDEILSEKKNIFSEKPFLISDEERIITGSNASTYIKIAEGCNQNCSFCAIPNFKGRLQSRKIENIIDELQLLTENNFYDFSFIAQDTSSYLRDFSQKDGLITLIDKIESTPELQKNIKNARFLYLYPSTTSLDLIKKIDNSEIFDNYFDMPIQHISDNMLKIMRRGLNKSKTIELLEAMRKTKDSFIRTSFIIGHPEETDSDFNELLNFIKNFRFDRINVFAYSNEENTKSHEMEQLSDEVINSRVSQIEEIIKQQKIENLSKLINTTLKVIFTGESEEHEYLFSARPIKWALEIDGDILINDKEIENLEHGKLYLVKITELIGEQLVGTIVSN
jgi:ribosomal protein S12 methylthiotransferase RimO